ncbi:MAG TPA: COX15/CtaA family protein [Ilumatobacteraceae bacterium]|nr:COX15/CtaA family protein [Ilumatobacteraceae bacterium]
MPRLQQTIKRIRSEGFTAEEFRRICTAALVLVGAIVVTGAAVRLSGSGLGCNDWPNCNDSNLVDVSTQHSAIEQINRMFTFVVGLAVVLAALGAWVRRPHRRDLLVLSTALVAGIPAQGILGAIVVWTDLNPVAVQAHFVLSMVLVALAVVLMLRSAEPDNVGRVATVAPRTMRGVRLMVIWTALAIVAGTVVTGTGPHAGDEKAHRFTFLSITWTARIHSAIVWVAILLALSLLWHLRHNASDRQVLDSPLTAWMCVAIAQGGVGYLQYANGVPAPLVGVHVALATTLWGCSVWLWCATSSAGSVAAVAEPAEELRELVDGRREERAD